MRCGAKRRGDLAARIVANAGRASRAVRVPSVRFVPWTTLRDRRHSRRPSTTLARHSRDAILPFRSPSCLAIATGSSRRVHGSRRGLPAHTHWITKPGWGHVPMWIDPAGVAQVIADGTR